MSPFELRSLFLIRRARNAALFLSLGCAVLGPSPVQAQAPKQDGAAVQALRKAQGMLRQLSREKAALEGEKAALLDQVKKLEDKVKQLEGLENVIRQQKLSLENLRAGNESLQGRIHQDSERILGLSERLRAAIGEVKKYRQDNALLVNAVAERSQWIQACSEKNQGLYRANRELLSKYQNKGFWEALTEGEPITQIGLVKAENEIQEFRFKLEDLRATPWQEAGATAPEGGPNSGNATLPPGEDEEDEE